MTNSTYFIDNTTPIVAAWLNDVNTVTYAANRGTVTATTSQTVFTVPFTYRVGSKTLHVYVNGLHQILGSSYTETTTTSITFNTGIASGAIVEFTVG